jgi:hypothetical protein
VRRQSGQIDLLGFMAWSKEVFGGVVDWDKKAVTLAFRGLSGDFWVNLGS